MVRWVAAVLVLGVSAGAAMAQGASDLSVDFGAPITTAPTARLSLPTPPPQPAQPEPAPTPPVAARPPIAAPPPASTVTVAPSAPSAAASSAPVRYDTADLASQPTAQQIIDAYPAAAKLMSVRAKVTLECQVAADGQVHDCKATSVSSRGTGFEDAALKLQSYYRMRPQLRNGQAQPGVTSILINFSPSDLKAAGGRF